MLPYSTREALQNPEVAPILDEPPGSLGGWAGEAANHVYPALKGPVAFAPFRGGAFHECAPPGINLCWETPAQHC
jgi:hypothetical protein